MRLLEEGYLVRGAICSGLLYHDKRVVFGPALIKAYEMESTIAKYPRIIIEKDIALNADYALPRGNHKLSSSIRLDADGWHFLHILEHVPEYLQFADYHPNRCKRTVEHKSGYHYIRDMIQKWLDASVAEPHRFDKILWLSQYWNDTLTPNHQGVLPIRGHGLAEPKLDLRAKHDIVEADFGEFMADKGNLLKARYCAGALFDLHDWVYAAHKTSIDAKYTYVDDNSSTQPVSSSSHFANSLGQAHPDFQLMAGIANASKHLARWPTAAGRVNPPEMSSHSANTYVMGAAFQPDAGFQMGDVMQQVTPNDIEFATLAKSVLDMWNRLFEAEGW
jgi:hypothetical protein